MSKLNVDQRDTLKEDYRDCYEDDPDTSPNCDRCIHRLYSKLKMLEGGFNSSHQIMACDNEFQFKPRRGI